MGMSKCLSRKIGTVLVRNKQVIGTGYNGPPRDVPHCDHRIIDVANRNAPYTDNFVEDKCPRQRMGYKSGEGMELCPAVHAEVNPIMQAARMGTPTDGATLYCYCGTPCKDCAKEIIQSGVKRVVCLARSGDIDWDTPIKDGDNPAKRGYNFPLSQRMFELAGVKLDVITDKEIG